jgi:hypothetical protein
MSGFMELFWSLFPSRRFQNYIFSSTGTVHFTLLMAALTVLYVMFGPKSDVIDSTVGDEDDNSEDNTSKPINNAYGINRSPPRKVPRRVVMVQTPLGKVRVTVVGDESARGKLVTFHDIGTNHLSCFGRFFGHSGMSKGNPRDTKVWEQFVIYHIDAPGHEEEAEDLARMYLAPSNGGIAQSKDGEGSCMTMGALAGARLIVNTALQHFSQA